MAGLFGRALAGLAALLLAGTTAHAETSTFYLAHPDVADAVTLRDGSGNSYILHAVSAPDPDRECVTETGLGIKCTEAASAALQRFSASVLSCRRLTQSGQTHRVRCEDFMGRDIGARMVAAGWAHPDRAVSQDYIFEALEAEGRRIGMWRLRELAKR